MCGVGVGLHHANCKAELFFFFSAKYFPLEDPFCELMKGEKGKSYDFFFDKNPPWRAATPRLEMILWSR